MTGGVTLLDDVAVGALIGRIDALATLRAMFLSLAEGRAVQPAQTLTLFPDGTGDVISYGGVLADRRAFGVKLSPYIAAEPRAIVTAWTLLLSMDTGLPLMLCDSKRLTTERTAATTALAVDLLASADARELVVIGAGPAAEAHIRHALALRPWTRIRVHSRSLATLPASTAARLSALDPRVELETDREAAVRDAEVVMLCTASGSPVIDPGRMTRPALITSISTNVAQAHEIPPAALGGMDVYCDYRSTTPPSAGEMRLATDEHGWSADRIKGDLPELSAGTAPLPDYARHAFFRSIGLGLEDIAIAAELHRLHLETARDPAR